jgi:hypothetical protein
MDVHAFVSRFYRRCLVYDTYTYGDHQYPVFLALGFVTRHHRTVTPQSVIFYDNTLDHPCLRVVEINREYHLQGLLCGYHDVHHSYQRRCRRGRRRP